MHNLTPTASEVLRVTRAPPTTGIDRFAAFHARARHRRVLGVRLSAIVEVLLLVAVLWVVDLAWGRGNRFAGVAPHPLWIPVLLTAAYYGTREALYAAVVCTVALLWGHFPTRAVGEGGYVWLLRAMREPLLWLVAAVVLGEIRDAFRRRTQLMQESLQAARDRAEGLSLAIDRLARQKDHLETRVADQAVTVNAMYNASRAIEREGVGNVLVGVTELVRTALNPKKFSLHLLNGGLLEAAVSEGWVAGDRFARVLDATSPLFQAVVSEQRHLAVVNARDEPMLRDEGILAGPIVNGETREVIGMLKIESMDFLDLHASSVQNFQLLCAWIGAALAQAQRGEQAPSAKTGADWGARVAPPWLVEPLRELIHGMVLRTSMQASTLQFELTLNNPTRNPGVLNHLQQVVARTLEKSTLPEQLCCATNEHGGYVVFLPYLSVDTAKPFAARIILKLRQALEDEGVHAMVRQRLAPLVDSRRAA